MCGFAGFYDPKNRIDSVWNSPEKVLKDMTDCIVHRGPDDSGAWVNSDDRVALGFRRLSILDLSSAGHQPMESQSGRFWITFNGEIYNFADIRNELGDSAQRLKGHSDTEILLAAIEKWGLVEAIKKTVGMFAIVVWDKEKKELHLVRDRLGEKPLYYGASKGVLLWGSELKSLRAHPAWEGKVSRAALTLYLRHNYVPAPYSIYEGIKKVIPGSIVTFKGGDLSSDSETVTRYWSPLDMAEGAIRNQSSSSESQALSELESLLRSTIKREMVADVPLGAFLSGGVDSSLLVALMQAQSSTAVKTFTIGFNEAGFNEAEHAKAVARHIGTDHTEMYITPQETLDVIPLMPHMYDEPFADSSQIPTYLVAKVARQHVTVSLSGEGGDELFAGYNRYFWGARIWKRLSQVPPFARQALGGSLRALSTQSWDSVAKGVYNVLPERYHVVNAGHKIHKAANLMGSKSADELYRQSMTHWQNPELITDTAEPVTALTDPYRQPDFDDVVARMMYFDMVSELPDDILVKVDRASMAVSLESRAPFLDHNVVEFAWRLPLSMKVKDGKGKWILRELLYKYVPKHLIDRPKMGFGVPIDTWLKGELKEWAGDLLSTERLRKDGYLNPKIIRKAWDEHQQGTTNHSHQLWGVLMFQAWLDNA